jgi:3D (Asp-Asp-Asp) domain-containing protein
MQIQSRLFLSEIVTESEPTKPDSTPTWDDTYEVTWYTAGAESTGKRPGDEGYGITASGRKVKRGVTAACPPSLPFGTKLRIEGVGERTCTDRGSAITEGHIDVYSPKLETALDNGRQELGVKILK